MDGHGPAAGDSMGKERGRKRFRKQGLCALRSRDAVGRYLQPRRRKRWTAIGGARKCSERNYHSSSAIRGTPRFKRQECGGESGHRRMAREDLRIFRAVREEHQDGW